MSQLASTTHVVLVQVGDHGRGHVSGAVAQPLEPGRERLVGLAAVTMPRLAEQLSVGTMSLYRHIGDKDDLVNAVAERVLSDVEVPDGGPDDWEGRVIGYLRALRAQALAHPSLSAILATRGLTVGPVFDPRRLRRGLEPLPRPA